MEKFGDESAGIKTTGNKISRDKKFGTKIPRPKFLPTKCPVILFLINSLSFDLKTSARQKKIEVGFLGAAAFQYGNTSSRTITEVKQY